MEPEQKPYLAQTILAILFGYICGCLWYVASNQSWLLTGRKPIWRKSIS